MPRSMGLGSMANFVLALALTLSFTVACKQQPRRLSPTEKTPTRMVWHLAEDNTVHRCSGKIHLALTPKGFKRVVEGCAGVWPQIILKD